jgi:putative methyltransferase
VVSLTNWAVSKVPPPEAHLLFLRAHRLVFSHSVELAGSLIRCSPGEDKTNGFFVSCFVAGLSKDGDDANRSKKRKGVKSADAQTESNPPPKKRKKKGKSGEANREE